MDILLTGGAGQVGIELQRQDWGEGVTVHAPGRDVLDLADAASVERVLAERPWGAVISSGAYTAVKRYLAAIRPKNGRCAPRTRATPSSARPGSSARIAPTS